MAEKTLPDKPSELLKVALADLEAAEASDKYHIEMGDWHGPRWHEGHKICEVCLAGSVMAMTLGTDLNREASPSDYGDYHSASNLTGKLWALNDLRGGDIICAFINLNRVKPDSLPDTVKVSDSMYSQKGGEAFKCSMRNLIALLEEAGE